MKNKYTCKAIFIMLLALYSFTMLAQIGPIQNTVIPPSPTSAVFREFAGYTPNLATGSVNVPISLYDIKVGGFTIPISLQYYTSGIKVTDNPYPAGFGWILSPGLRITRTIMGRPDMTYPMDISGSQHDFTYGKKAMYDPYRSNHDYPWYEHSTLIDTQHDIFTVHLPHGDYTFLIDKQGNEYVAITANNHLKIKVINDVRFEVIDENGVVYHFGNDGTSNSETPYTEHYNNYVTSWMLRKIILPGAGNEINLTWEHVRHSTLRITPTFAGDVIKDYKQMRNAEGDNDIHPTFTYAAAEGILVGPEEYTKISHLKQISFPTGTVDFTYRATNNPLITGISVKNKSHKTVKTIGFTYGTGLDERLLLSIEQSDEGVYQFQYHSKCSSNVSGQDYWGYYNGKNNNSLVPAMDIKVYNNRLNSYFYKQWLGADRSINAEAMKANILTKVTYPTGGYSAFEYEPHEFVGSNPEATGLWSNPTLTQGGGLRVTKVTTSAGNGAPDIIKTYKYGPNENGKANVIYLPTLDTFIDECDAYDGDIVSNGVIHGYNLRLLLLNSQSNYMRYAINTPALWYSTVTEYVNNENKTVYLFNRHIEENSFYKDRALDFFSQRIRKYANLFSKGCLMTKEVKYLKSGSNYTPLQETTYNYAIQQGFSELGNKFVNRSCISLLSNGPDMFLYNGRYYNGEYEVGGNPPAIQYTTTSYVITGQFEKLTNQQTIYYNSNGNIIEQISYDYYYNLLRSKTTTTSNGYTQTEQYLYPMDYAQAETTQQSVLLAMRDKNMLSTPFLVSKTVNGKTERTRTEFKDFGTNLYLPEKVYYKKGDATEVCKNVYDYDAKGNLRGVTQSSAFKNTYLWGYDSNYPVAVIEGLSYDETLAIAGSSINNPNAETVLYNVRNAVKGRGLMTSYTYEPLIGITSVTSPAGQTTSYSYDVVGRLEQVKDKNNKSLQRFYYHRQGETMSVSFTAQSTYAHGTNVGFTASASGGSRLYNYKWTLKNSSGTTIYTSSPSESSMVSISLQQTGTLTLTCEVTDKMSGETQSCSRTFTVADPVIKFTDISQGGNHVYATISCLEACKVTFYLNASMNGGTAGFYLAGERYWLEWGSGMSVDVNLSAGFHSFSIDLSNSYGGESASMYITGLVSPTLKIGSPSYIGVYN